MTRSQYFNKLACTLNISAPKPSQPLSPEFSLFFQKSLCIKKLLYSIVFVFQSASVSSSASPTSRRNWLTSDLITCTTTASQPPPPQAGNFPNISNLVTLADLKNVLSAAAAATPVTNISRSTLEGNGEGNGSSNNTGSSKHFLSFPYSTRKG
ncbi:hypothetical protein ACTXT7_000729 [Hymenolepis weldensis]